MAINSQLPPLRIRRPGRNKKKKYNLIIYLADGDKSQSSINSTSNILRLRLPANALAKVPPQGGNERKEIKGSKFSFFCRKQERCGGATSARSTTPTVAGSQHSNELGPIQRNASLRLLLSTVASDYEPPGTPVTRECLSTVHRLFTRERRGPLRSHIPVSFAIRVNGPDEFFAKLEHTSCVLFMNLISINVDAIVIKSTRAKCD